MLIISKRSLISVGSDRRGVVGGGGVEEPGDVDVGVGGEGRDAHDSRLTSHGATSQHSRQSAVSGPGAQSDHYRHSQLQLYTVTQYHSNTVTRPLLLINTTKHTSLVSRLVTDLFQ